VGIIQKHKKQIRGLAWVLFIIYILAMAYFLFFSEALNRAETAVYHYNLVLFKEIKRGWWLWQNGNTQYFILNVVGNVVAFVPFGFTFPIISPRNNKFINITLLSMEMTLGVEIVQLMFKVGSFDIDDIFLNVSGAVAGYVLFRVCNKVFNRRGGKKKA